MSLLEYLGLEYLFNSFENKNDGPNATGLGGLLFFLGIGGWILLAIFKPGLIDKGAAVFNLIAFIGIIGFLFYKFYSAKKNNELNIGFLVISILAIIISFIVGFFNIYHSIIYNYEYGHIGTGITYAFISSLILHFLFPFFCHYKSEKVSSRIGRAIGSVVLSILGILVIFFIGQAATVVIYFTGNEELYSKVVTYHNLEYNVARLEFGDLSIDERLNKIYSSALDNVNKYCSENTNVNCDEYKKNNYKEIIGNASKDYGYSIVRSYKINDNEDAIKVSDKEFSSSYTYYIFNKLDFSIKNISEDNFNSFYQQN